MRNLFVPYEISVALKEKGFDEPCFGYYVGLSDFDSRNKLVEIKALAEQFDGIDNMFLAPLYQQVMDFFRDKHIHIEVNFVWIDSPMYMPQIVCESDVIELLSEKDYYSALNKAIEKALELIN